MKISKNSLREKIKEYFKKKHPNYVPTFYIQGSYKMGTTIRTKDDICDLDDGIYFFREPDVTATTLQIWVKNAVDGHTQTQPEHRKKCVRNIFAGDFEIDMPVYFKIEGKEFQLAVKDSAWEESDPKAMVDWFNSKKDSFGVLTRIIKYLKCWCDFKRNKMPNGLSMTILASNAKDKIRYNENRDDISLRDTLKEIKRAIEVNSFQCIVPVVPNDDLFRDYEFTRKDNFISALNAFIEDAEKAVQEKNQKKSSILWAKHLGDRFPIGNDIDDNDDKYTYSGLFNIAKESKPWKN